MTPLEQHRLDQLLDRSRSIAAEASEVRRRAERAIAAARSAVDRAERNLAQLDEKLFAQPLGLVPDIDRITRLRD